MLTRTQTQRISQKYAANPPTSTKTVKVFGLPIAPLTLNAVIDEIDGMIKAGRPEFLITANLNFAMLARENERLRDAVNQAAMIVADGMPLVWGSRLGTQRLPERVTGADLVPAVCERAAEKGHRIFLLGGAEGAASRAAEKMIARYPGLQIVGVEVPPFRPPSEQENAELIARIRSTNPDILLVAYGQPKGDLWILDNYRELRIPVSIQIGATINFMAGEFSRAPKWVGKLGLEWVHRLILEPKRLGGRYARNTFFLATVILEGLLGGVKVRDPHSVVEA